MSTLEAIRKNKHWRDVFPGEALVGCESALLLFCAGSLGAYDGVRVLEAGIQDVTAVDSEWPYLDNMRRRYPEHWQFVYMDAWEFARSSERRWDFVSVDPPTHLAKEVGNDMKLWGNLAGRSLIVGNNRRLKPVEGFTFVEKRLRSQHDNGWYWNVLRRS